MSAPETRDEVMAWFGTGHHAGHYDLHGLSLLMEHAFLTSSAEMWHYVLDYGLLNLSSK